LLNLAKAWAILARLKKGGKIMSVMVTLELPAKPECLSEFLDVMREALIDTRAYQGCEKVETFVEESTGKVLLVELWETAGHQQTYMAWRMETGLMDAIGGFLSGAPVARTFSIKSDV
jgi:quinol monooxygenase YgiN